VEDHRAPTNAARPRDTVGTGPQTAEPLGGLNRPPLTLGGANNEVGGPTARPGGPNPRIDSVRLTESPPRTERTLEPAAVPNGRNPVRLSRFGVGMAKVSENPALGERLPLMRQSPPQATGTGVVITREGVAPLPGRGRYLGVDKSPEANRADKERQDVIAFRFISRLSSGREDHSTGILNGFGRTRARVRPGARARPRVRGRAKGKGGLD
jgi:hypothetical protein